MESDRWKKSWGVNLEAFQESSTSRWHFLIRRCYDDVAARRVSNEFLLTEKSSEDRSDKKAWSRRTRTSRVAREEKRHDRFLRVIKGNRTERSEELIDACITSVYSDKRYPIRRRRLFNRVVVTWVRRNGLRAY